ncbi:hypothetical protein [Lysinibacillus sp. NPDC047702]|uniref:hypothetical protein n=1 Tax=unclassified Lysinibacillus TaxID=2636778 RepID=UPI003D082EF5
MNYYIFGACEPGKKMLELLTKFEINNNVLFIDNGKSKSTFCGIPVKHPDGVELHQNKDIIFICSYSSYDEMKKQLIVKGLREDIDFYFIEKFHQLIWNLDQFENSISQIKRDKIRYHIVEREDLTRKKTSDTIFLLGSGSTINKITEKQWGFVQNHDSWGFNYWLVHNFKPTFYSFEIGAEKVKHHLKNVIHNYLIQSNRKDSYPLDFIKDVTAYKEKDLDLLNERVDSIPIIKDMNLPCRSEEELRDSILFLDKLDILQKNIFVKLGTTISTLIVNAFILGYKNIVLCGIDLDNSGYFYDGYKPLQVDTEYIIPNNRKGYLRTLEALNTSTGNIATDKIIKIINDLLLKPNGVKLFVAMNNSELNPEIPLYDQWE